MPQDRNDSRDHQPPPTIGGLLAESVEPLVSVFHEDVRVVIFNRPAARNAMSLDVRQRFARHIAEADADQAVRTIVVTGAGGYFSAGVDLKEYRSGPRPPMFRPHPAEAARAVSKPVIAAVDGYCLTGGLEVALSCSFVIASDRAVFGDTHAKRRLYPSWRLSALLPAAVGVRRARQMSLTGEFVDAETARQWGLVNEVTGPENLLTRCLDLARSIGAADPVSSSWQLDLMRRIEGEPLATRLEAEFNTVEQWRARPGQAQR
jgi:enoyl-CoA hydratase